MSITVGRIANKFWKNADGDCPNGFPIYEEQQELKSETPNMNDFMSGTIYLIGDSWNHCKYDGAYYNLYIVHLVSHRKKRYLYRLERDLWMDMLIHRPRVVGDLSNSNNDELLEANLNRTISALDNPARVITVNFGNVDFDWTKEFVFRESKRELKQTVLSKDNFENFVSEMSGTFISTWKTINSKLYTATDNYYSNIKAGTNDSTFIFGCLHPSSTSRGGKHILREKINEFIKSIDTDKGKELKIAKLNSESFKTSPINGNYCITHKVDGISTTQENIRLKEIDLSNLTDIVPIKIYDLSEIEPATNFAGNTKSGLFEIVDNEVSTSPFFAKIRRKAYIPINASPEVTPDSPEGFWPFREDDFNGNKAKDPQVVNGSFGGRSGLFHLWFLDNVNFMVTRDGFNLDRDSLGAGIALSIFAGPAAVATIGTTIDSGRYSRILKTYRKNSYFGFPSPGACAYSPFEKLKEPVVPFGFLIYGLQRRYGEWKTFRYIGQETKREVQYYSGIKNSLLGRYAQEGEGWSKIDEKLAKIQPTEEFTKFYLDNYNFSGLCFFPTTYYKDSGSDPYLNTDGGGTWKHAPGVYYVGQIIRRDIHDIDGKKVKENPYNDERYPGERARIDANLSAYLNRSLLQLPEGFEIEKDDYFFSDQDYEIVKYPELARDKGLLNIADETNLRALTRGEVFSRLLPFSFVLEDMMEVPGGELFASKPDEKMVVLCTTNAGGMEIRTLQTFERELTLSLASDEIVQNVDGTRKRSTTFTLIKKLLGDFVDDSFKGITDKQRNQVLYAFYKLHGYKVRIVDGVAHWTGFDESDFSAESNTQQLFDLVGTDGYAFVAKGKISLIAKKTSLFAPQKGQSGKLLHDENKDLDLSLVEKINQKVRFQFFGVPYYLNGKSSFHDRDRISLKVETMTPTELQTNFDQYFIFLDTEFDQVYYENVSLAKKQTKALSPADSVQLEKLNLDMAKAQYSYQIDSDKYKIAVDRFNEKIKRAETDLYHSRVASGLNLGAASGAGAFGTGMSMRYREGAKTVTTIGKGATMNPHFSLGFAPGVIPFQEAKGMEYGFESAPMEFKEITKFAGKTPNIMAGVVAGAVFKTSKLIMDHAFRFPEQARRIGVEKQIGAADLALQSLSLNTKFIEKQLDTQLAINQKTNIYSNPIISEREIMESFMDKDEWHGKKLKPAHLVCFVPSEEQLVALREFKDQYGVMCDIPNVETYFYEGMPPDVIRYRNLDDEAITGLPNEGMRAFLKAHLLAGIKIRQVTRETYKLLGIDGYKDKILRLNVDLLDKADEIDRQGKEITVLQGKVNTIAEETKAECAVEASELQKKITNLENEINEVNRQLREKLEECKKGGEEHEKNKEELHKLKVEKEELEQKLADERRRAINEKDEINRLKKELEEAKAAGSQEADKEKIKDLEKQLAECKSTGHDPLEETRKQVEELQKTLECGLAKGLIESPYEFDPKSRENGGDAFMDLIFELATALRGEGRSHIDQRLLNIAEMRPLIERLEELKNIPIVDKAIDVMQDAGGSKYIEGLGSGGEKNGEIRGVIEKMNQIKMMSTVPNMHAVKALLDELNFRSYKAIAALGTRVNTNEDIQNFFHHIYPGKSVKLYSEIFGPPKKALIRKIYAENAECTTEEGRSIVMTISNFRDYIDSLLDFVPIPVSEIRKSIKGPNLTSRIGGRPGYADHYVDKVIVEGKEIPVSEADLKPIINWYENAKKEGGKGRWTPSSIVPAPGKNGHSKGTPGYLAIVMGNYPYYVSVKNGSYGGDNKKKVVGFRKSGAEGDVAKDTYGHYFEAIYYPGTDKFKEVGKNRDRIIIPDQLLKEIVEGTRKIELRLKNIESQDLPIQDYIQKVEFEADKGEIPDDKIEDFIKLVFIFHAFRLTPWIPGLDSSDNYTIYAFKGGGETEEYLKTGRWKEDVTVRGELQDVYYRINKAIASIKDQVIQLDLGGLFGRAPSGKRKESRRKIDCLMPLNFLNMYFYLLLKQGSNIKHPGDLGDGQADKLFRDLDEVKKAN